MADLFELQRQNLISYLTAVKTENDLKYLVLDETSSYLVNSLISMKSLLQVVTAVERIDQPRSAKPAIEAVYILDPTKFSLACLKTDFKSPPRYKRMHIYLLQSPANENIKKSFHASNNPAYSLIRSIADMQLNFQPIDKKVFLTMFDSTQDPSVPLQKDFDDHDPRLREKEKKDYETFSDKFNFNTYSMQLYYNPAFIKLAAFAMDCVVNSLLNLCIITNEYPIIRYYSPSVSHSKCTAVSRAIAIKLQSKIDEYLRNHPEFKPNSGASSVERSILLVTDRSLDLIETFIHEFDYESILYDFQSRKEFNTKNQVVFYSSKNANGVKIGRVSKLSQIANDKYYEKYRYLHISEAYETLNKDINKLFEENSLLVNTQNASTTTDLLHIMAHSTEFNEERRLLTLHKQLLEKLLSFTIENKFPETSSVEQILTAGGYDINGQHIRLKRLTEDTIKHLEVMGELKLDINHKIRLIAVYALTRNDGITMIDLIKLLKFIGVHDERELDGYIQMFKNLHLLNRDVIKLVSQHHHGYTEVENSPTYHVIDDTELNTSRYKPGIYKVLSNLANGNQQELQEFPFANEALNSLADDMDQMSLSSQSNSTSLRNKNHQANWQLESTWSSRSKSKVNRPKIFLYMVGGITKAEIKSVYELSEKLNKDIIIGSEHILVPGETIFNIKNLHNSNTKELNLYLPSKLSKESGEQPPSFLIPAPPQQQLPPPSQQRPGQPHVGVMKNHPPLPGAMGRPSGSTPPPSSSSSEGHKKHRFGFKKPSKR